ncbi:MAG: hypothetical protein J6P03_07885 [Opitutales bacterium]|nr:hypothetical protein [Opitutales bacterium]
MKILNLIFAPLILALCACTSVSYTDARAENGSVKPNAKQVLITNYGYYLFNCVPLFSGGGSDGSFSLFSNNIKLDKTMNILKDECERLGVKKVSDIQFDENSTCFFSWVEVIGTTLGIYWYKDVQLSAVLYSDKFSQE